MNELTATQPSGSQLEEAIFLATKTALLKLFAEHPGHFYYITLITSGEAHAPFISAWSDEALHDVLLKRPQTDESWLRWSYADSPYMCYGEEFFTDVHRLFSQRPQISPSLPRDEWAAEYELRLCAMENAMARLDEEGLFGTSMSRSGVVVNVEVMPPDRTNTERAKRLNPQIALSKWLAEAAEE